MKKPSFLMVLTGIGDYAYKRPKDGVLVVPSGRMTVNRKIKRVKFGFYTDLCYLCNKIADDDDCKAISHRHTNVLTDYS